MSYTENNNNDQINVLHIGPQIELEEEEVKQMKNSTNLNVTCCKSSSGKVFICFMINNILIKDFN